MEREIWFEKALWSYVPCHWKGFAVIAAFTFPTVIGVLLGQWALDLTGHSNVNWLPFPLFFVPALFSLLAIAKCHS